MRPRYKVSQAGVDLIEAFEGLRLESARLDDGRWTIGYGHTRSAREGARVSRDDALMLLRYVDLPPVEEAINALVSAPLTQNQYDALVAFVFNVGVDAFRESEVLERLNAGRLTEAACALELWRKADIAGDPVVLDALIRRRAAEKALFLAPGEGAAPTPSPLVRPRRDARAARFLPAARPAEIEAVLVGERAGVRLVAPYEIEPDPEMATAVAPEPAALEPAAPEPAEAQPTSESAPEPEAQAAPEEVAAPVEAPVEALAALAAWAAEIAEVIPQPEPAPTAWTVEPQEPEAPTAWTVERGTSEPQPERQVEPRIESGGEPVAAPIEPPATVPAAPEAAAPTAWTAEPDEADLDEPAPSSWIIGVTPPAAPAAPAAEVPAAEPAAESVSETPGETATAAAPEAPPAAAPAPEELVREVPAANAVLQTSRALPEASPRPRPLYSSYGPMAFAVAPPPTSPAELPPAQDREGAAATSPPAAQAQPVQAQPVQPQPIQAHPFQTPRELTVPAAALEPAQPIQSFAPPVPAQAQPPATASAPAVTADAAPTKPLILTSPPADWEEPRAAASRPAPTTEADELDTPLFDEGWDGPGALSGRIVHHEAPEEHDARASRLGATGPFVLMGFVGFVAFGGALFALSRGHTAGGGAANPVVLGWILAVIGAALVGVSAYFLFRRLGGQED